MGNAMAQARRALPAAPQEMKRVLSFRPRRFVIILAAVTVAGAMLRFPTPVVANAPLKKLPITDVQTQSFFGPPSPFCSESRALAEYLRAHGFVEDGRLTFETGATITRYHYLGDWVWLARSPDGESCLLAKGALDQDPMPPRGCRFENMCPND
jgi:hypothetical protein